MKHHLPNRGDPLDLVHQSIPLRLPRPGLSRFNFANHHETSSFTYPLSVQERYSQRQRTGPKTSIHKSSNPSFQPPKSPVSKGPSRDQLSRCNPSINPPTPALSTRRIPHSGGKTDAAGLAACRIRQRGYSYVCGVVHRRKC